MSQKIDDSLSTLRDAVLDCAKSNKPIMVTTHIDCDGLVSGAVIAKAMMRAGAKCTVTTTKDFGPHRVATLQKSERDLHVITDLGSGFASELDDSLGEGWFVLDHHQIPNDELDNPRVINSWKYGIDGGTQICAGGMAYLAAIAIDDRNEDLSAAALVSALGDRQDVGERKSLTGKNQEIASKARDLGLVKIDLDLLLVGRETKPLADALAFTSQPFIDGLTWNRDRCFAVLTASGVQLKDGNRWRVPSEISDDEKRAVIETIAKSATGGNTTDIMDELIGYTYTFPCEDQRSFLRDGREFSTMLNSCGRIGKAGIGIAICMGDRSSMPAMGEEVLAEYRKTIKESMKVLSGERWRTSVGESYVMVNGEGVVQETMTGTVCSLIAASPKYATKIVILRTDTEDGTIKFSARKSFSCKSHTNLSSLMRKGATLVAGNGGGHDAAAGASVSKKKLDEFLDFLEDNVDKMQSSDSVE